jgi:hypothetical protein
MVCRNGLGATELLVVAVGLVAAASAVGETPVSPYPPVQLTSATPSVCNFDRIMLAPGGDRVVVWAGDKRHILATQMPPPFGNLMIATLPAWKGAAVPPKLYYGPDLFLPVRFEGPRLWVRATRNRILAIDLMRLEEGAQPLLRASYTRRILAFPDARNFEGGIAYVGAPDRGHGEFLPYRLPIVDLATGKVVGRFNDAEIRPDGAEPNLAPIRRMLAGGGALLVWHGFPTDEPNDVPKNVDNGK